MATQLIRFPQHLLGTLLQTRIRDRWPMAAGEHPPISLDGMSENEREFTVAVAVHDPMLAWDQWPAHGTGVSALIITTAEDPGCNLMPRPLPDDLVVRTIDAALPVLCSLVHGGHDALELADIMAAARHVPNALPLPPRPRAPGNRFERRLRETALQLDACFAARLEHLHQVMATYGDALLRSGLGSAIDSLSAQGALADWLCLKLDQSTDRLQVFHDDPRSRRDLLEEHRKATSACKAANRVLQGIAPYTTQTRWPLSAFDVADLYRVAFAPDYDTSIWRRDDPPFSILPYFVPAAGIEAAMLRFAKAFDRRLLGDIDPIVVAALGFFHMMCIAPYGRSDSDVGRLLLQVLLRQADLPPTPLPLVLHRRYWEHASTLDAALRRREPGLLVEAMVAAIEEALSIGEIMIRDLGQERTRLLAAVAEVNPTSCIATNIISDLQSNVLVPRQERPETTWVDPGLERELSHLRAKGLVDVVSAGGRIWWSSAVARQLARS